MDEKLDVKSRIFTFYNKKKRRKKKVFLKKEIIIFKISPESSFGIFYLDEITKFENDLFNLNTKSVYFSYIIYFIKILF